MQEWKNLENRLDSWQLEGIRWMLDRENLHLGDERRGFILADTMGSGKTHQVCGFLSIVLGLDSRDSRNKRPTLVIVEPSRIEFWRDIIRWMTSVCPLVTFPGSTSRVTLDDESIVLIPHSMLRTPIEKSFTSSMHLSKIMNITWDRVIVDEAQKVMAKSSRAREVLDAIRTKRVWSICGCSKVGTMHPKFHDIVSFSEVSDQDVLARYTSFGKVELETVTLEFRNEKERILSERVHEIRENKTLVEGTLRCQQVCADYRVFLKAIALQASFSTKKSQEREYVELVKSFLFPSVPSGASVSGTSVPSGASVPTQGTTPPLEDSTKASYLYDRVSKMTSKVVVLCNWRSEVSLLSKGFEKRGISCSTLMGSYDGWRQSSAVDDFETSLTRVLVATLGAASSGLNLQCADHVFLTSPQSCDFKELQAAARIDRKGQRSNTKFVRLVVTSKTHETIDEILSRK